MSALSLTDWLSYTPVTKRGLLGSYVTLPVTAKTGLSWGGASEIKAQYNYSASTSFRLLSLPAKPTGVNYGLCIRYRVGTTVTRYKLWEDDAFILQAPLYTNEIIKPNFVLEMWSHNGETTLDQAAALNIITSVRSVPTTIGDFTDVALAVGAEATLEASNTYSSTGLLHFYPLKDETAGAKTVLNDTVGDNNLAGAYTAGAYGVFNGTSDYLTKTPLPTLIDSNEGSIIVGIGIPTFVDAEPIFELTCAGGEYMKAIQYWDGGGTRRIQFEGTGFPSAIKLYADDGFFETISLSWSGTRVTCYAGTSVHETTRTIPATDYNRLSFGFVWPSTYGELDLYGAAVYSNEIVEDDMQLYMDHIRTTQMGFFSVPLTFDDSSAWLDNA